MRKLTALLFATILLGSVFLPATVNANPNDEASEILGQSTYCKTEYSPIIDGDIDEIWDYADELSGINYNYDSSIASSSGYAKVLWNETNLFLLAVVSIEDTEEISTDNFIDGVIFRVSETSSSELTFRTLSGDWEYGITSNGTAFNVLAKDLPMKTTYKTKWNEKAKQYIVELHVPLQTYRLNLEENDSIAFNFFIREDVDKNGEFDETDSCSSWQAGIEGPASLSPLQLIKTEIHIDIDNKNSNDNSNTLTYLLIGGSIIIAGTIVIIFLKRRKAVN